MIGAFGMAVFHPICNELDLRAGQVTVALEIGAARVRRPWRHVAALRNACNLGGVLADVLIREQREWPDTALVMTRRTAAVYQRRKILIKGDRIKGDRLGGAHQSRESE